MHDVAQRAGVSQSTVSFVINNRTDIGISDETKERVLKAVRELDYRPNAMARGLRSSKSQLIGLISDEIAATPYAVQIISGAQDAAWELDQVLLVINTGGNKEIKDRAVRTMIDHQVESIVYATMYHRAVNPPDRLRHVPCVLLNCFAPDRSFPSVVPDEVQGGRTATEALILKGHRRIGFINNIDAIPATFGRLAGYQEVLASYGLAYDERLVQRMQSDSGGGYDGAQALMQLPDPPTAIFCFNDRMAMGAYDAVRKIGRSIPEDVAIIGFDDEEMISAHLYPPLTTVQLPHYEMGQWAIDFLSTHSGATLPPVQHLMDCPLISRASI
jgi:LacI family transcriptional regulator